MRVKVRLQSTSQPIEHETTGPYEKGSFYCVPVGSETVKYPIANIFSIVEDYGYHAPRMVPCDDLPHIEYAPMPGDDDIPPV